MKLKFNSPFARYEFASKKKVYLSISYICSWHVQNVQNKEKVLKDEREHAIISEKISYRRIVDSKISVMDTLKRKTENKAISSSANSFEVNSNDFILKHQTPTEKVIEKRTKFEDKFAIGMGSAGTNKQRSNIPWYTVHSKCSEKTNVLPTTRPDDPIRIIMEHSCSTNPKADIKPEQPKVYRSGLHSDANISKKESEYEKLKSERLIREKAEKERELSICKLNKPYSCYFILLFIVPMQTPSTESFSIFSDSFCGIINFQVLLDSTTQFYYLLL